MKANRAKDDIRELLRTIAHRQFDRSVEISRRELELVEGATQPVRTVKKAPDLTCKPGTTGERREGPEVEIVVFVRPELRLRDDGTVECRVVSRKAQIAPPITR